MMRRMRFGQAVPFSCDIEIDSLAQVLSQNDPLSFSAYSHPVLNGADDELFR